MVLTGNMYMNYMDFTDDRGMHMFTYGQRDCMRTLVCHRRVPLPDIVFACRFGRSDRDAPVDPGPIRHQYCA